MHDNPNPDALAAALGLKRLLEARAGRAVTLGHGGIVGRAQNRAMVETLGMPLTPVERSTRTPSTSSPSSTASPRPETTRCRPGTGSTWWSITIRSGRPARAPPGATSAPTSAPPRRSSSSTCRARHHPRRQAGDRVLLRAATETRDLGRESTGAERTAYLALVPLVDHGLLYRMSHPKVPREHFAALDRALRWRWSSATSSR